MNEEASNQNKREAEDLELVRAFQGGNENVFNMLVLKHKNKVFSLCYRYLGNYDEANDSAQEVFVKVYRSGVSPKICVNLMQ